MIKLCVPTELREKVAAFIEANGVNWSVVDAEPCDIRVAVGPPGERRESNADTLESSGWISCPTARAMGKKHGIAIPQLGALLNELDVKVRRCLLGCFP